MPEWLSVPLLVDVILLGMAIEACWLFWRYRKQGGAGMPPFTLHLLSGALLLVGMKLALAASPPPLIVAALGLAGLSHAWDLYKTVLNRN